MSTNLNMATEPAVEIKTSNDCDVKSRTTLVDMETSVAMIDHLASMWAQYVPAEHAVAFKTKLHDLLLERRKIWGQLSVDKLPNCSLLLSTDYYPEGLLRDACKGLPGVSRSFPWKTTTSIDYWKGEINGKPWNPATKPDTSMPKPHCSTLFESTSDAFEFMSAVISK